jgi:hypothetical protein
VELLVRSIVRAGQGRGEEEGNEKEFLKHGWMRGVIGSKENMSLLLLCLFLKARGRY